jgi:3'-phosphoadenosine 5'-phosphosulfate sulfotransferase (PAPS reductase)/FAD synthetase
MCFDYVRAHKEPINPLYSLGFEPVGCSPCVNSSKEDIRRWADRSPEMIDKVRAWERRVGFYFLRAVRAGNAAQDFPEIWKLEHFNWIDEVVEWSRTDRGGRQFNIL